MTWKVRALKHALRVVPLGSVPIKGAVAREPVDGLLPGFSASGQDVWLEQRHAQQEVPGLVLSAVGARCGKVFDAPFHGWGVVANTTVLRSAPDCERRFLWYLTNNEAFWERGGTAQPYVLTSYTLDRRMALPPLAEQRRIADFLDDQVALLDRAITLRKQQKALMSERLEAERDGLFDTLEAPRVALRYLADFFSDGDWIESPYLVDDGIRLIQTGNVGVGRYKDQGFKYITEQTFAALNCTEVYPGDVLISRLSPPVGRSALAPDLGKRMVVSVDVAILRSTSVLHSYLVQAMSTRRHLSNLDIASRGATMARVSRSQLGSFSVAVPDAQQQRETAATLTERQQSNQGTTALLDRSLALLAERKQALITAAVTGEFDVTTARKVSVDV